MSVLAVVLLVAPALAVLAEARPVDPEPESLPLRQIHRGHFANLSDAYFVIEDRVTYERFHLEQVGAAKPPAVDFARELVLVAAYGYAGSSCGFGVSAAQRLVGPGGDAFVVIDVAMALPSPFVCPSESAYAGHLVAIPRAPGDYLFKDALTNVPLGHDRAE